MKKSKIFIIAGVVVLLVAIGIYIIINANKSNVGKIHEKINIEEENIELVVNSVEEVKIDDPTGISLNSGDYLKVDLSIKNNNNTEFSWIKLRSFNIIDSKGNTIGMDLISTDDELPTNVSPNGSITGSLYFKTKLQKNMKLSYTINDYVNIKNYYIKLK